MTHRILLRAGHVLSMDPAVGDLPQGDVLIEDGKIAAVDREISADAEVLDMTGRIVIPGFVDTHRHTWEASIRNVAPDATLDDYFVDILDTFAPLYTPEDVYAANLAGSLECLNSKHHHARRLVPHQQHARAPGRGDPGPHGDRHPRTVRLRQRQHLPRRLLVREQDRDPGRRRTPCPHRVLRLGRRPAHPGPRHPRPRFLRQRRRHLGVGPRPRSGHPDHRARGHGTAHAAASGWSSSSTTSDCSAPTPPTSTAATSARRSGGWSPTPAVRSPSRRRWRRRWGTAGRR